MKVKHLPVSQLHSHHVWRPDFRGYATQWGYRPRSGVAKLIDHLRDEYRAFYEGEYKLRKVGKNRYRVTILPPASRIWETYAAFEAPRFGVTIVR